MAARQRACMAAAALVALLSLQACDREPPRVVKVSPSTGKAVGAEGEPPTVQDTRAPIVSMAAPSTPGGGAPAVAEAAPAGGQSAGGNSLNADSEDGAALLAARTLVLPVQGMGVRDLSDNYDQVRGGDRPHEALDIMAARGTPVLSVDEGTVAKLFKSEPGGLTVYIFDPSQRLAYYYAHLDGYAPGLTEGAVIKRGDVIGYVGSTGNASRKAPHLHFTVFRLGPERQWWKGAPVNPYKALKRVADRDALLRR